jgi:RNA polymerase sigma-70 factor (ECF subfamily)
MAAERAFAMEISPSQRKQSSGASNHLESTASAGVDGRPPAMETLVPACQRGDQEAMRQLYELSHASIYRLMVRMVGPQDAADLTQQVYLQIYRNIGQFAGRSRFKTWLYRLAVNEALQFRRKDRKVQRYALDRELMDKSPGHRRLTEQKDLLEQGLARLEPQLRSIFLLREVEGLSYNEIAEALNISEGTVGSRLNRARRKLKEYLIELGWEP